MACRPGRKDSSRSWSATPSMSVTSSAFPTIRWSRSDARLRFEARAGAGLLSARREEQPCYGFVPLATQAPPPHFRFEEVVTTLVPLLGARTDGFCFAAPALSPAVTLPTELPVTMPPAEVGFVAPPIAAGFVTAGAGATVPPMTGAGFEAPPIAFCFVLAGPPSAFCAREGRATVSPSVPIDTTSTIILIMGLFFMDATFAVAGWISPHRARSFTRDVRDRISLSQAMEM